MTDIFGLSHLSFHEKDGARREYRPIPEYIYNALPFFFPPQNATSINAVSANRKKLAAKAYNIAGIRATDGRGFVIENGKIYVKR